MRGGARWSGLAAAMLVLGISALVPRAVAAQGTWEAILAIDPQPSPYLSDWEANRRIGTLTVFNGSGRDESVRLVYSVRDGQGRSIASGASTPRVIPADVPTIYDSPITIEGSTRTDATVEAQIRRTGRLPEGSYEACITVADLSGFELTAVCESFTLVYPEPPALVAPANGEEIGSPDIFFQWTPAFVPIGVTVQYVFQVAEVREGQLAQEALQSGALHFVDANVGGAQLQYPLGAPPLRAGARYAWRVRALDVNGYAVASNQGSSEVWTFRYDDGSGTPTRSTPGAGAPSTMTLKVAGTSLRDAGGPGASLKSSMAALCATSDEWAQGTVDSVLTLDVAAPLFGGDELPVKVEWGIDTSDVLGVPRYSQRWVVSGKSTTREYLAKGDCDGPTDSPGLLGSIARIHFVATQRLQHRFSDFLAGFFGWDRPDAGARPSPGDQTHDGVELEFGTAVLALREGSVGESDASPLERAFFGRHAFEVKPGLNAFGVVRLPEHGLWRFMRNLGWGENAIELQGFVGLSTSVSAGVGVGSNDDGKSQAEGNLTVKSEFLALRMAFPELKPKAAKFIRSMRAGIVFTIEDSASTGVGNAETVNALHFVTKLTSTWVINDNVTIEWTGGIDRSRESKPGEEAEWKTELVLNGACDCVWVPPVGRERFWIGNPLLEFHVDIGTLKEVILLGSFEMGFGDPGGPTLLAGGSLTWKKDSVDIPAVLQGPMARAEAARQAHFAAEHRVDSLTAAKADELTLTGAVLRMAEASEESDAALAEVIRLTKDPSTPEIKEKWNWTQPAWRVRAAAGNIGIVELIEMIRSLF